MLRRSNKSSNGPMVNYYSGKSIFITGGTGFLGKVLIEKLLRSCSKLSKIYLLIRNGRSSSTHERLEKLMSSSAFQNLNRYQWDSKIVVCEGDISLPRLGLSDENIKLLEDNVNIVFHVAASVRFDDPLKKAILTNTRGTYELLKICHRMKKLEVFTHVSTTYCNTHHKIIEEKIYPAPADWKMMIKMAETRNEHILNVLQEKILGNFPNTYTYTKNLSESLVNEFGHGLPIVIVRPSIVISSIMDPIQGYADNFNGPVGLIVGSGKGVIRSIRCNPNAKANYIPVDVVIRGMMIATWHKATQLKNDLKVEVYNASCKEDKLISHEEVVKLGHAISREIPLDNILWLPGGNSTQSRSLHYTRVFFQQIIPAFVIDMIFKLTGRKQFMMKLQRKIFVAIEALSFFMMNEWGFINENFVNLNKLLSDKDLEVFDLDYDDIDVSDYFRWSVAGGRYILLKETKENLPQAKIHYKRMYWIDKLLKLVVFAMFVFLVVRTKAISRIVSLYGTVQRSLAV